MDELRCVDPKTLVPNPRNPRRTPAAKAMDEQLVASILAIGLIQPPRVAEIEGDLVIVAGSRRVKAAIAAGLDTINVLVGDAGETTDAMRSVSENMIREPMTSVDIWRATEALEAQGWNEQAIAAALALPVRIVKRLKLLAHLHPAMLDCMAKGSMPNEDQLRTIAAASEEEQAQVWKKLKPKKGQGVIWFEVARALSKRRMPATAAKFDDDLARAYGVVWEDDLFAPAGEDSRTTTNVEGFFGAQQEWLANNLPAGGSLLPSDEYGRPQLPKKAEPVYGKPGKGDVVGHYLDPHSGEVKATAYRMPEPKKAAKPRKNGEPVGGPGDAPPKPVRPEVTQKGCAMIGDLRTDALHKALADAKIDDTTMIALLVLAFGGKNVSVQSGASLGAFDRGEIGSGLTEGGALTNDPQAIHDAARGMLIAVLSCRDNMSNSGPLVRIAGDTVGASLHLPNMATEEFLSCLSKAGIEKVAAAEGVRVEFRGKDTRARMIERFKTGLYVYPPALFKLSAEDVETEKAAAARPYVPGLGQASDDQADDGGGGVGDEGGADGFNDAEIFEPEADTETAQAAE